MHRRRRNTTAPRLAAALVFAWVYEMTPEGLKKEKDIDRSQSITPHTGRKINVLIIVLLVLAIATVLIDRLIPERAPMIETAVVEKTQEAEEAEPSTPSELAAAPRLLRQLAMWYWSPISRWIKRLSWRNSLASANDLSRKAR